LADKTGILVGSRHQILTGNLQMSRIAAAFVPQLLTLEQKENRLTICQDLKNRSADPNILKTIITGGERWIYGYDLKTKVQSCQKKTKFCVWPKTARQVRSIVKAMLIVFLTLKLLFINNLYSGVKQSIKYSIKTY